MVKSHFYSLLQIGWREDNFFSITFHALPTIPIALAKKRISALVISLAHFFHGYGSPMAVAKHVGYYRTC